MAETIHHHLPQLIDTGGWDDNVSLQDLASDPDPRFRPSQALATAVVSQGYGTLDRPVVPLLNALTSRGLRTVQSCGGGMLFVEGIGASTQAALRLVHTPWMQQRWTVGGPRDNLIEVSDSELWWSRRRPNWGGFLGTDADWRWRGHTVAKPTVDAWLLAAAEHIGDCALPEGDMALADVDWLPELVERLAADPQGVADGKRFEVVLTRDTRGWSAVARRGSLTLGSVAASTLPALRARIGTRPRALVTGEGIAGCAEFQAAMKRTIGGRPWRQLGAADRQAVLDLYAIPPSRYAARAVAGLS